MPVQKKQQMPICSPRLKQIRLEARLSQNRLARLADLDRGTVARAERGDDVSDLSIAKMAQALSVQLNREISLDINL